MGDRQRCEGVTKGGTRCKLDGLRGERYCRFHLAQASKRDGRFASKLRRFGRRFVWSAKYQVILGIVLVLPASIVVSTLRRKGLFSLQVTPFLSALAEALGAIAGLTGAFLLFWYQSIHSRRQTWYMAFRAEVRSLGQTVESVPATQERLRSALRKAVWWLEGQRMRDFPIGGSEYDDAMSEFLEVLEEQEPSPLMEMILSTGAHIEEFAGFLSLTCIEIIIASHFLRPVVTLLLVLVASLIALLTLGGTVSAAPYVN